MEIVLHLGGAIVRKEEAYIVKMLASLRIVIKNPIGDKEDSYGKNTRMAKKRR